MITAKVGTKYSLSHSRFLTMSPRISALLGVIMYAPIVAIAVSFGFTGYALLNDVPGISQGSDWSMSPYD